MPENNHEQETDFDTLFNAEPAPAQAAAPPQETEEEDPPRQEQEEHIEGGDATPAESGDAGGADPDDAGDAATADDWLASLPEEVQARIKAERKETEDRYTALHNRLAPTQRRLSDVETRLAQLQKSQPASPPAKQDPEAPPAEDSIFDSDGWKSWAEDFPGDAKVLRAAMEKQQQGFKSALSGMQEQVRSLAERLGQTEQVSYQSRINEEEAKLDSAHGDWRELNQSQEFWDWWRNDWRAKQPKSLRPIYYDEEKFSELWSDAEFAIHVIDDYKAQHAPSTPAQPEQPPKTESAQAAKKPSVKVAMAEAPTVKGGSRPPAARNMDSLTEDEKFDALFFGGEANR